MKKINDNDLMLLKIFLKQKEPNFVAILNLRYDMDYYYGIANQILNGEKKLNCKIEDFDLETKKTILDYIQSDENYDNKIFFHLMEIVYYIFCKYYNDDGTIK